MAQPSKTILVIDDNREITSTIATVLKKQGYNVATAHDGNTGLTAIERDSPTVIIVDMMLPKASGFLLVEEINRQPAPPPVIMITANEGRRHRAYAEHLGIKAYLQKPFAMGLLVELVDRFAGAASLEA